MSLRIEIVSMGDCTVYRGPDPVFKGPLAHCVAWVAQRPMDLGISELEARREYALDAASGVFIQTARIMLKDLSGELASNGTAPFKIAERYLALSLVHHFVSEEILSEEETQH